MKAIVFDGTRSHLVDDVEVRDPGPGEVRVRIVASGLCQSDLSVMNGKIPFPVPVILGHEGAGIVETVGPGVSAPQVGDHVVLSTLATCGHCVHCVAGVPTMCRASYGSVSKPFSRQGEPIHNFASLSTFTSHIVVRAAQAISIPKDVPFASACLIGCCVLTGAGAVLNRARVQFGDSVVVIGAGGVGLNSIQAARLAGAGTIIAIDVNASKEILARQFGATHFIDVSSSLNPVDMVREITGDGARHVFDCVGGEVIFGQALEMLSWAGQLVLLGMSGPGAQLAIPGNHLYMDKSVMGCRYGSSRPAVDVPRYIDAYCSGTLHLDELVSATFDFEEFEDMVDAARSGRLDRGVLMISPEYIEVSA